MQCIITNSLNRYQAEIDRQADEADEIKKWADELYEDYINATGESPLPWIVDAVEEQLSCSPEFWQAYRRSNWAEMKSIRESVVQKLAELHWIEELESRIEARI